MLPFLVEIDTPPAVKPIVIPANSGMVKCNNYINTVKNWNFKGPLLPAAWEKGNNDNHGYANTLYTSSQVKFNGTGAVELIAAHKPSGAYQYQSGWIDTSGRYYVSHGRITYRAKMPAGQGLWSGLWMVNWAGANPLIEIDVQEMLLGHPHTIYGSLHNWVPLPTWDETQQVVAGADLTKAFHNYEVVWQPGQITWALDGTAYAQYTKAKAQAAGHQWHFDNAQGVYLVANLAVAGEHEWGGPPNSLTKFPATMLVQSITIRQQEL